MKPFVVIAEDEAAVSELLRYNLESEGYETAIASDGDEAMLLIDERIPDLMLLDWMLNLRVVRWGMYVFLFFWRR